MSTTRVPRPPGRPRSQQVDEAVLAAALDLLIERGASETSIEQVAQRAGVTRATVYRRFPGKTALLIQAIESVHQDHAPGAIDWPGIDPMLDDWALYLSVPRNRRMLRRLYGAVDDHPELLRAYRDSHGARRAAAEHAALARSRERGELSPDADLDALQQILGGAVLHHLGACPDTVTAGEVKAYLVTLLRQTGYRPQE
ncbi:helix-turn-helix transcriptional regulator [Nonomuraea sp. SMC257]|uniref:Helix-turn-helix transcriptional regulator n=1 Tax=Nonomuraea montanisoli TaxID=2741721 RepID=A0A7Y6M759_9ACTN|nr:TetR/AcrR family transcriptional regulator [Nonomuraea montanisoli]NUW37668.1 helix-turn-helix transcriptional regulator [Nonomuraea montanisoli]